MTKKTQLAKARAETVRDVLKTAGVAEDRIALVKPSEVMTGTAGAANSRRVDIVLR